MVDFRNNKGRECDVTQWLLGKVELSTETIKLGNDRIREENNDI